MSKKNREQFIQGAGRPDLDKMGLGEFRSQDPVAQGRIIAKGLNQLSAQGVKISPVLQRMVEEGRFADLASGFGDFLGKKKQELVERYGKPLSGQDPKRINIDFDVVTRKQIREARGSNLVHLLQALHVIDPDL